MSHLSLGIYLQYLKQWYGVSSQLALNHRETVLLKSEGQSLGVQLQQNLGL